jgi:branched-chain amino acid transport system permease protein
MLLKHFSSQWNPFYWMLIIGVLLIAVVMLGRGGLLGLGRTAIDKLRGQEGRS